MVFNQSVSTVPTQGDTVKVPPIDVAVQCPFGNMDDCTMDFLDGQKNRQTHRWAQISSQAQMLFYEKHKGQFSRGALNTGRYTEFRNL